jgi:NMD protein affecting ribosome stability and mRNA decay
MLKRCPGCGRFINKRSSIKRLCRHCLSSPKHLIKALKNVPVLKQRIFSEMEYLTWLDD